MPDWSKYQTGSAPVQGPAPAPATGSKWDRYRTMTAAPAELPGSEPNVDPEPIAEEVSSGIPAAAGGLAALGGLAGAAALVSRGPGIMKAVGSGLKGLEAVRKQFMLSGMALPKSLLGNVGAAGERAIETKSLDPLRQMFSRQTLRDARDAYRNRDVLGLQHGVNLPGPVPGRLMGAMDVASRNALTRSGASAAEAESAVLQAPLRGDLGEALESPAMQYLFPFRRTPFNVLIEGGKKFTAASKGDAAAQRGLAAYGGAGVAHGAATAEDEQPYSIPLAMAASARYGMPYGLGALLGRVLAGGRTSASGIAGSMLPVSEYGVESAFDPTKPFRKPAALTALERLTGGGS